MNKNIILKLLFACCIAGNPLVLLGQVQAVDLGLSVKWADRNITKERSMYANGIRFSWGELRGKYNADYANEGYGCCEYLYTSSYKTYYVHSVSEIIGHPRVEFVTFMCDSIGDNISGTEYDAAKAQLGEGWRIPTRQEFQELIDKCTWTIEKHKKNFLFSSKGYRVTGPNGNSIFLPMDMIPRGFMWTHTDIYGGYYWTSDLVLETEEERKHLNYAWCLYFSKKEKPRIEKMIRFLGLAIRAVCDK